MGTAKNKNVDLSEITELNKIAKSRNQLSTIYFVGQMLR